MRATWPRARALLVGLLLAGCGGGDAVDPIDELYPELDGRWQYRSEIRSGDVVCIEHGALVIQHGGGATFSGQASVETDCFQGLGFLSNTTVSVPVVDGRLGARSDRGSWSVAFQARPGWSYAGEAFISATGSLVVQGTGATSFDPGTGETLAVPFEWTLCAEFVDPSDFVERVCR